MVISADLSDELTAKIDALVINDHPPAWPFPRKTVTAHALSPPDLKLLEKYQSDYAAYEAAKRDGTALRNRSAVVRKILTEYFANHNHNA